MTDHSTTALGDMLRQLADDLSTHENLKQRVVELEQLLAERPEAQEEAQQEVSLIEAVLATRSAIAPLSKPLSERVELLGAALDAATTRASELEAETVNLRKKIEELEAETVNVAMHHRAAELYAKLLHDTIATLSKRVDVTEARIDRLLEGMAAFKDVD